MLVDRCYLLVTEQIEWLLDLLFFLFHRVIIVSLDINRILYSSYMDVIEIDEKLDIIIHHDQKTDVLTKTKP